MHTSYTIRIEPVALEIASGKVIKTTGCDGKLHGPVLRFPEGRPVNTEVVNNAGYDNIVHWHGSYLPAVQDEATERIAHYAPKSVILKSNRAHCFKFQKAPFCFEPIVRPPAS